jgi:thiamine kinase-like enzyme/CTP:phosphocholine cytidylyltransferase-like protein
MSNHTVIIPTAGLGSRMGELSKSLNKSLLPYLAKPVIAHIIDQFPKDTRFIIPVGYAADQVMNFCNLVYKDRHIEFVHVSDWTSDRAGPGYTVKHCLDSITGPFWYVPCDTFFAEDIVTGRTANSYFVTSVPADINHYYTMFNVVNDSIQDMKFKESVPDNWLAFTGVMYIHDWQDFKNRLSSDDSPEIIWTIKQGGNVERLGTWLDFGNLDIYKRAVRSSQKYDFTKDDEVTYICNNRVIKWWRDPSIAEKKYRKSQTNIGVYPDNVEYVNSWLAYDYFDGVTLYQNNDPSSFDMLLEWLGSEVWKIKDIDISKEAHEFYKTKTLSRIAKFLDKYPSLPAVTHVDGVAVKHWEYYLNKIDWTLLSTELLPGYTHGDLQFDNLIIDDGKYRVIDWRHEFAGLVELGDVYYDLAKLTGGFIINYSEIKDNHFEVITEGTTVKLVIPSAPNSDIYLAKIKEYTLSKGWSYKKVQLLIPIIFWNMSPLHTPPFDKLLWYLGMKLFEELDNDN